MHATMGVPSAWIPPIYVFPMILSQAYNIQLTKLQKCTHRSQSDTIARHDAMGGIYVGDVVNKGGREKSKTTALSHQPQLTDIRLVILPVNIAKSLSLCSALTSKHNTDKKSYVIHLVVHVVVHTSKVHVGAKTRHHLFFSQTKRGGAW